MDPSRHHDFIVNNDDRSNKNLYYGREITEISPHHYYGSTTTRTISNTRKPCGCTTTGNGTTAGSITCNGCRLNPPEEGWGATMANPIQIEHPQQRGAVSAGDFHRMSAEASTRSSMRQSPMYMQQHIHHQQQHASHMQQPPVHGPNLIQSTQQHPAHVGSISGSRISYWPQSGLNSNSSSQPYADDEHIGGLPTQPQLDISVTRRNAPASNEYGQYKSSPIPPNAIHPAQKSNSGGGSSGIVGGSGYQLPSSSSLTSSMPVQQRGSTIADAGVSGSGSSNISSPYMTKERIYEHQKPSPSSSTGVTAKMSFNTTSTSAIYDSHHQINNQVISKTIPVDHHVINPSNMPASKEQHPSPNYARKCPQMYTPEEQSTAHQHLYMSTPQFSSEKFTRASPQQQPLGDFTKLRESPGGSAYMVVPHSEKYNPHMHTSQLRESPQFPSHSSSVRNPGSYYGTNQTPSKILPPEMSPIILKQSHNTYYQYSKSPLPPPLPPSHLQQQSVPPPSQIAAKSQTVASIINVNASLGAPPAPTALVPGTSQRYTIDNLKREDLEIYESPNQMSSRNSSGSGIYINPYNTPPPTSDNCCKEISLSTSSSSYTTGSATPNYRVESPQFYPTKYGKLAMTETLSSSKHSLINQNTPPPSRAPSQRGQHQANYYYEGNSHSAPSPAAATAASPSPSSLLTTSQTPMHHTDYITPPQPGPGTGPSPTPIVCHSSVPNIPQSYTIQPPSSAQQHHHHQTGTTALRNNDIILTVQPTSSHPYERAIQHQSQPPPAPLISQHVTSKHALSHLSSISSNAPVSTLQIPSGNSNSSKMASKHQKPNYRELINQKLAMRNATSEEELNLQIIKKTLNVDTQSIRAPNNQLPLTGSRTSIPAMPTQQISMERIPSTIKDSSLATKHAAPIGSVLVTHNVGVPAPSTGRIIEMPEAISQGIYIKQEDDKPTSSGATSSSPLDLSMRTVKTKADSTDYKYQQKPRLPAMASSTTPSESRYTLPRVDSTPIFSVHAFEPGAANASTIPSRRPQTITNSRQSSLERRNFTPPTQGQPSAYAPSIDISPYPPSSIQHIPSSPIHQYGAVSGQTRRNDLSNNMPQQSSHSVGCYENSLVIKTAPKLNNPNSDLVVRPSTITAPPTAQICRPSVLETNPYATVIKTETKQIRDTPPASPHHTLAAVERLPPDTSIMALPARNPYGVVRSAIQSNHNANISNSNATPPSNYTLACEKNPNFLGRKRHLQEYSNQMSLNEPATKQNRYVESPPQPSQPSKPQIAMRPADISVIAVNEVQQENFERKSYLNINNKQTTAITTRPADVISPGNNTSVIASTTNVNNSKVIVNNVKVNSLPSTSVVVCKQEPLTPTGDNPPLNTKPAEVQVNASSARIRTKAELKGFTFNPPPPIQRTEINNSPPSPPKVVSIKKGEESEVIAVKIKEEIMPKIDLPKIPGLYDEFKEENLLDFGWSNTCENLLEQLLTRSTNKKKCASFSSTGIAMPVKKIDDSDMLVVPSETGARTTIPLENNHFSIIESADNTTRSSFARLDGSVESSITFNNLNQDSINSQCSGVFHKKLSKTEREKKRFQQEKRLAERLKAKESSSETEDELDKRKTERLKKPPMKTKNKLKSPKSGTNTNSNSSSSHSLMDKNRFSDCGSDSSGTEFEKDNPNGKQKSPIKIEILQEKVDDQGEEKKEKKLFKNNETGKCDFTTKEEQQGSKERDEKQNLDTTKKSSNSKTREVKISIKKEKDTTNKQQQTKKVEQTTSGDEREEEEEQEQEDEEDSEEDEGKSSNGSKSKVNPSSKGNSARQALNTMTRSKHKQELEQQLANSKVLRNDKIIRNFSSSNSSNKIKRKYTRKYNTVNSFLESGGLSRESGIMKSTRLKAKLEKNSSKLNMVKNNETKSNNSKPQNNNSKEACELKNSKPENVHDRNVIDLYRFKRALKVPPSLINIKHPGAHKIATSLPDLEMHAEALGPYVEKRKNNSMKTKSSSSTSPKMKTETDEDRSLRAKNKKPKSIIDLLHSRVAKASCMNVRSKTTTSTAVYRPIKPCCTTSSNNSKISGNNNNNSGIFSETSQTTESSELQMLPELKKDSDIDDENDDNESANGKKRHFSIFDTKVLPTKTRTESKLQQKKENIREIFVGDDRPASAPPEMTQTLDCSVEKMTYEQKYEQFLQQMNIVISADKLGRLGRSTVVKKLATSSTNSNQDLTNDNIKQEEVDTESTSVIDADELKEDHKSESVPSHLRKRRSKYLRRKGSSGFDYIRKKKKPTTVASTSTGNTSHFNNGPLSNLHQFSIKAEKVDFDEYEHKVKTEDDVSREIQKWVLNKGVGQSTMHKAARLGYIDVIVYCLDRMGMNPDQKDNAGYTPLHEACTNGWLNIGRVLLQYGANHSEAAHSGIRPLHEASENDHEEIVRLLLSYGADPLLATYSGQTPLMLASSKPMRDILSNHLVDVQSMGPDRQPWKFNGPWEIYDPSECGYNVFEGVPNTVCDMSRALLRRGSLTNSQMYQNNKKLQDLNTTNTITVTTATSIAKSTTTNVQSSAKNYSFLTTTTTATTTTTGTTICNTGNSAISNNNSNINATNNNSSTSNRNSGNSSSIQQQGIEIQQQQQELKREITTKTVMEKCAVVLDNIDRFNSVRLYNDNKPEILVENSDSDGEMFEFEEADVLLPPLYLLKDEGTQDKWVLLNDLCNLLKVKSKDTLLNKIYPSTTSSSSASVASAQKSLIRELKMSDFLEKATCLQLLCAGEKLNICASKVVLIKYNENVRNLLGVKTILMKF